MARYFGADEVELICLAEGHRGRWQAARVELHARFPGGEGGCVLEGDDGCLSVVPEPAVRRWRRRAAYTGLVLLVGLSTAAGLVWVLRVLAGAFL